MFKGTEGGGLVVSSLAKGGPAEMSGQVRDGDNLIFIDGEKIAGMSDRSPPASAAARRPAPLASGHLARPQPPGALTASASAEDLAKRLLGPLGREVTLGLQRTGDDGESTMVYARLVRSLTDAQRAAAAKDGAPATPWVPAPAMPAEPMSKSTV